MSDIVENGTPAELLARLQRIYAAVDATVEGDLSQFPPRVTETAAMMRVYQDFVGGMSQAQVENLAYSEIDNIAHLRDHLKKWCRKNGHDVTLVQSAIDRSLDLRLIIDLSDRDKHGGENRNSYSGVGPQLKDVKRVMRMTTSAPGVVSMIMFTPSGPVHRGGGSTAVVVTGSIVDRNGAYLSDLNEACVNAVKAWEETLESVGVSLS